MQYDALYFYFHIEIKTISIEDFYIGQVMVLEYLYIVPILCHKHIRVCI